MRALLAFSAIAAGCAYDQEAVDGDDQALETAPVDDPARAALSGDENSAASAGASELAPAPVAEVHTEGPATVCWPTAGYYRAPCYGLAGSVNSGFQLYVNFCSWREECGGGQWWCYVNNSAWMRGQALCR
jgi:hypothetical protein